jgi:Uncharacterized conserved protein (DUF2285)
MLMQNPSLNPEIAEAAPTNSTLTPYDHEHLITYLRMLDADAEGAAWEEVAQVILHIDPKRDPDRAKRVFDSHLARAKWMAEHGYRRLLRDAIP